jgi:hypothetical protein
MQTIHIDVNDNYVNKLVNMLENLKGIMLEDIKVDKKIDSVDESSVELMNAQTTSMAKTWDNAIDEAWDDL